MKKLSPRAVFIQEAIKNPKKLAGYAYDAMQLASTHDPDHVKDLQTLYDNDVLHFSHIEDTLERIETLEKLVDTILQ